MKMNKKVRPSSAAWRTTLAAAAALAAAVGFGTSMPAFAGAGWGDSTNTTATNGQVSVTGALKVPTYYANSPMGVQVDALTGAARDTGAALKKFVDPLPGLGIPGVSASSQPASTAGTYIAIAYPQVDPTGPTYADADYYELAVVEYTQRMHSNLAKATTLRGYVQIDPIATDSAGAKRSVSVGLLTLPAAQSKAIPLVNVDGTPVMISRPDGKGGFVLKQAYAYDNPSYLGPTIIAGQHRATRLKFYNGLPAGHGGNIAYTWTQDAATGAWTMASAVDLSGTFHRNGDLFLPTDITNPGGGDGPVATGTTKRLLCGDVLQGPNNAPGPTDFALSACPTIAGSSAPKGYEDVPAFEQYTQNREELHLHGGDNPWLSDGHPHQWITPAADEMGLTGISDAYRRGEIAYNVPDMAEPGPGAMTYYYPNGQSGRLLFYHDHASGLTRLNVYAGTAAGYLLYDGVENTLFANALMTSDPVAAEGIPLVIQDKTFVPKDIATEDAKWDTTHWGQEGDLWFSHVYETNQDPLSGDATNPVGRWDGASFFWPVFPQTYATPDGTYGNVTLTPESFMDTPVINGMAYPTLNVDPKLYRFRILSVPNDRMTNLSWFVADSTGTEVPMVPFNGPNGPTVTTYACPDGVSAGQTVGTVNANGTITQAGWTESGPNSAGNTLYLNSFPCAGGLLDTGWGQEDNRPGGVPDPKAMGPHWIRVGNEGGLLEQPVDIPPTPINYEYNKRSVTVLNVLERGLWLGPAERADVLVDFAPFAGKTLILYNDSGAPVPAGDPRIDYFTGDGDQSGQGGAPNTVPGYGPNTRTIMQVVVGSSVTNTLNGSNTAFTAGTLGTPYVAAIPAVPANPATGFAGSPFVPAVQATGFYAAATTAYMTQQGLPAVPTADYAPASVDGLGAGSLTGWNFTANAGLEHIWTGAIYLNRYQGITFTPTETIKYTPAPVCSTQPNCLAALQAYRASTPGLTTAGPGVPVSAYVESKAIQELFEPDYGRMNATLGVELPFTSVNIQTTIPLAYVDPATETIQNGEIQFWKITHNGVDSHPVHFHMLNVQVLNRVGWDGTFKPLPADEIGWKETVKMHPLEDIYVAVRAKSPPTPFGLPHSQRHLMPSAPTGDQHGFTQIDPVTGAAPAVPYSNQVVDYASEYVWHCHILGHEENDFMRPFIFHANEVLSPAPSGVAATVAATGVTVAWTDATPVAATKYDAVTNTTGFLGNPNNEIGFRVERSGDAGVTWTAATSSLHTFNTITNPMNALANSTSYLDTDVGQPPPAPVAPAAPALGAVTPTSVTLNLPALVAPATSYNVLRNGTQVAAGVTAATYVDTGLSVGNIYTYTVQSVSPSVTNSYEYRVVAVTAAGDSASGPSAGLAVVTPGATSAQSAALTVTMAPAAAVLTITNPTVNSLTANWGAAALATSYTVSMNGGAAVAAVSPDVVAALASNTSYSFVVNAINATGATPSAPASGLTLPGAPLGMAGSAPTTSTVLVNWTTPGGAAALTYNVQCSTDPAFGTTVACTGGAGIAGTSTTVGGLAAATSYYFRVQAVNASGAGAWSAASAAVTTQPIAIAPGVPTSLAASSVTATSLTLNWAAGAGGAPASYTVQRATNATFTAGLVTVANVAATSLNVTGLTQNTNYFFHVLAVNAFGTSAYSTSLTVRTLALPARPAAPSGLTLGTLNATAPQTITMTLPALPAGATSFTVYVQSRTGGGAVWGAASVAATGVTGTTYVFNPATANLQYRFYLVAVGPAGSSVNGVNSAAVTPRELANAPATSQATANAAGTRTITVSWTAGAANGATVTGYRVLRSVSNAVNAAGVLNTGLTTTNVGAATFATTTGRLVAGRTYYFQVGTVVAGGVSYGPVLSAVAR